MRILLFAFISLFSAAPLFSQAAALNKSTEGLQDALGPNMLADLKGLELVNFSIGNPLADAGRIYDYNLRANKFRLADILKLALNGNRIVLSLDANTERIKVGALMQFDSAVLAIVDEASDGRSIVTLSSLTTEDEIFGNEALQTNQDILNKIIKESVVPQLKFVAMASAHPERIAPLSDDQKDNFNFLLPILEDRWLKASSSRTKIRMLGFNQLHEFTESNNGILLVQDEHRQVATSVLMEYLINSVSAKWVAYEYERTDQSTLTNLTSLSVDPFSDEFVTALSDWQGLKEKYYPRGESSLDYPLGLFLSNRLNSQQVLSLDQPIEVPMEGSFTDTFVSSSFLLSIRNALWANRLPETERGIVYAGLSHFTSPGSTNLQDFIADKFPGRPIFLLRYFDDWKTEGLEPVAEPLQPLAPWLLEELNFRRSHLKDGMFTDFIGAR